jgi:hypothetical protein
MEPTHRHRQQLPQDHGLRDIVKMVVCGGMIGTALFFPLANAEGLWLRAVTLSIFILSALVFHALHLRPFVRFGPYTAAVALVLLLVAVLAAGSSRKEFIPWLPLFIASLSLITVSIHEISLHFEPRRVSFIPEDTFTGVSIDGWSERSSRTISTQQRPQPLPESTRRDSLLFARHGPSSRTSDRTSTNVTDISLSSIVGQCRPQWDARTRAYFPDVVLSDQDATGEPHARTTSPGLMSNPDSSSDSDSDHGSVESNQPLLGAQRGPET